MQADLGRATLAYDIAGPADAPVVLFGHSLAADRRMFDAQHAAFLEAGYRVLRYDMRGHGESPPPADRLTMSDLAGDVVALMDHLEIARVHYAGVSIGGMIGQTLGVEHGERLASLTLASTTSYVPEEMAGTWDERIATAESEGMAALVEPTIARWFTQAAREREMPEIAAVREMIANTSVAGFTACCYAVKDFRIRDRLAEVETPALVVQGAEDPSTTVEAGETIVAHMPDARLEVIADASHMANVERARDWTAVVHAWIDAVETTSN